MLGEFDLDPHLPRLTAALCQSYEADPRTRHIGRGYLPATADSVELIHLLLEVAYPGYYGRQNLSHANLQFHIGELLPRLAQKLYLQLFRALC